MSNIKINDVPQRVQYAATNGQTQFAIPFPFFQNNFIIVWQDGIQIYPGAAPGQYLITGAGSPSGGQITLITPALLGSVITIEGQMPIDRTSIYSATISNLTGSDLNGDFNREVVMMQQLNTTQKFLQLQYAPWVEISQDVEVTKDRYIPLLEPLEAWRMNALGTEIETFLTPDSGGIAPDDALYIVQTPNSNLPNAVALDGFNSGFMVTLSGTGFIAARFIEGVTNQTIVTNANGASANPIIGIAPNVILPGTGGMGVPAGTTAQRVIPTPPSIGMRFNTDLGQLEAYIGGNWVLIPSSAAGLYLPLAGGTMAGDINMDGNFINGLSLPVNNDQAASKEYVDNAVGGAAGGVTGNIQWNNGGAFAGDANFNTDGSGNVDVTGSLVVDNILINGNRLSGTTGIMELENAQLFNDMDANSKKIINLAIPTAGTDAVNKDYADQMTGRLISFQILTSGVGATYNTPINVKYLTVEAIGGGGGGGGVAAGGAGTVATAGGGGSGGFAKLLLNPALPSYTYTVGLGGPGGVAGANNGTPGGTTSFGATLQATGGGGGIGGSPISNTAGGITGGGAAGIGLNGNVNAGGQSGFRGLAILGVVTSGAGGSSHYGGGAPASSVSNGINAANYGSGGSGGSTGTTTNRSGGNGSPGLILVWGYT